MSPLEPGSCEVLVNNSLKSEFVTSSGTIKPSFLYCMFGVRFLDWRITTTLNEAKQCRKWSSLVQVANAAKQFKHVYNSLLNSFIITTSMELSVSSAQFR